MKVQHEEIAKELPWILRLAGGLRKSPEFASTCAGLTSKGRSHLYNLLRLRFWLHFHLFSPVLGVIFLTWSGDGDLADVLFQLAVGSLSFAVFEPIGGAYADKRGPGRAIRVGLLLFCFVLGAYFLTAIASADATFLEKYAGMAALVGQMVIGLPFSLINGADTVLTRRIVASFEGLSETSRDCIEGLGTSMKYSGLALASVAGCLYYMLAEVAVSGPNGMILKSGVFAFTIVSQLLALRRLSLLQHAFRQDGEREKTTSPAAQPQNMLASLSEGTRSIRSDWRLMAWTALLVVIEGWLLFSKFYFEIGALRMLISRARDNYWLVLIVPVLYGALSKASALGGVLYSRWRARQGDSLDSRTEQGAQRLLIATLGILVVMIAAYGVHSIVALTIGWVPYASLIMFAVFQFIRGVSTPLLRNAISSYTEQANKVDVQTTVQSIATAGSRLFHMVSALGFLFFLKLIAAEKGLPSDERMKVALEALAATLVSVVVILLALSFVSSALLLRRRGTINSDETDDGFNYPRLIYVKAMFFVFLATADIVGVKMAYFKDLVFNAGSIPYAFTFLCTDIVNETEGPKASKQLWKAGVASFVVVGLVVMMAFLLPHYPDERNVNQGAFEAVIIMIFPLLLGSIVSFAVAQRLDIYLYEVLSSATGGKALPIRNNISTFISQLVDTAIFVGIGFFPRIIANETGEERAIFFLSLVVSHLLVKWVLALVDTPLVYLIVKWVEAGRTKKSDNGSPHVLESKSG